MQRGECGGGGGMSSEEEKRREGSDEEALRCIPGIVACSPPSHHLPRSPPSPPRCFFTAPPQCPLPSPALNAGRPWPPPGIFAGLRRATPLCASPPTSPGRSLLSPPPVASNLGRHSASLSSVSLRESLFSRSLQRSAVPPSPRDAVLWTARTARRAHSLHSGGARPAWTVCPVPVPCPRCVSAAGGPAWPPPLSAIGRIRRGLARPL